MKKIEAVIFDMDGVIVDSEPRHEQAFLEVFEQLGYGQTHAMDFPAYLGRSDEALWLDFIAKHQPKQSLKELAHWKQTRLIEILRAEQPIFEAFPALVERISQRYKIGLASGSLHAVIDEVVAMKNLRRFFPVRVSVEEVAHGKPAPDVFLRAADLLGVIPAACCVIEDAAAGVQAALAAGMKVIAITNSLPRESLIAATHVVRTYAEIEKLLLPE
ncbi:MAG: HAD family phosphatase [Verrucomicrobiales bacterium]|nr:HAD family phosphatase [Verrucomicrobiales bacterium]